MSRASPASITSEASGLLNSAEHNNLTSDYPGSDCSSSTSTLGGQPPAVFYNNSRSQSRDSVDEEGFSHEDIIEDIEDGTSSVLSSSLSKSLSSNDECLAFRAPWATPPTATFEGAKQLTTSTQPQECRTTPFIDHCHDYRPNWVDFRSLNPHFQMLT